MLVPQPAKSSFQAEIVCFWRTKNPSSACKQWHAPSWLEKPKPPSKLGFASPNVTVTRFRPNVEVPSFGDISNRRGNGIQTSRHA